MNSRPPALKAFPGTLAPLLIMSSAMGASLTALYMFNGIQESVKAGMRLTDLDLSLVEGVAVAIPLALSGVPVGLIIDRVDRMRVMRAMSLLWIVAALGTAWRRRCRFCSPCACSRRWPGRRC